MENPVCTLKTSTRHNSNDLYEDLLGVFTGAKRIDWKNQRKIAPLIRENKNDISFDPPIEELVRHGVVCSLFDSLDQEDLLLEFDATWAPTNNASGKSELPNYGTSPAMQKLMNLYKSSRDQIQQLQSMTTSVECCDLVLDEFFLALDKLIDEADVPVLRTVSKTLYKFCVFLDPEFSKKDRVYSILKNLIEVDDLVVLTYACWAIASTPCIDLQLVVRSDVCPRLVSLLISHFNSVLTPVLLILGKVVSGTCENAKYLIGLGVLPNLKRLLLIKDNNERISKLACFFISQMTSYGSEHVQAVMEAELVVPLTDLLKGHIDCKIHALLAIERCAGEAPPDVFRSMFDESFVRLLCDLLPSENKSIVECCLWLIGKIFSEADESGLVTLKDAIISSGGFEKIWRIKCYTEDSICEQAIKFLRKYWEDEEYLCRGLTLLNS